MTRGLALGIDAGGTATRWRLETPEAALVAEGEAAPVSGHIDDPGVRERSFAALDGVLDAARRHGRIASVVAGITGLDNDSPAAGTIAARLAERCGGRSAVVSDMWIAYHAAFAPGEGFLIYSGTGSVALHVTAEGRPSRAGGHGYLIDDGGSGAWIALAALRALVRGLDEAPEAIRTTPLYGAVADAVGSAEWEAIRAFVYGGSERGRIGTLARATASAAGAGDAAAARILRDAGAELARLAHILTARHGRKPVALSGGTATASPLIREAFLERAPSGLALIEPARTPTQAAAALARERT